MLKFCESVELDQKLKSECEQKFKGIVEWYKTRKNDSFECLKNDYISELNGENRSHNNSQDYDVLAKEDLYNKAEVLARLMLMKFCYGPMECNVSGVDIKKIFDNNELSKNWCECNCSVYAMWFNLLQLYLEQDGSDEKYNINLAIFFEDKSDRNEHTHKGNVGEYMSIIRCYSVLERMLVFMDPDLEKDFCCPTMICNGNDVMQSLFAFHTFDFDDTFNVLVVDSLRDFPLEYLDTIANLRWHVVFDFDGATRSKFGGSMKIKNEQLLLKGVPNQINFSQNHTCLLKCTEYISGFFNDKDHAFDKQVGKSSDKNKFIKNFVEIVKKSKIDLVNLVYLHHDSDILEKIVYEMDSAEIRYRVSVIYNWAQEKKQRLENLIPDDLREINSIKVFSTDLENFLKGLQDFDDQLPMRILRGANKEERRLPHRDGSSVVMKKIDDDLAVNLEKSFEVLYDGFGDGDDLKCSQYVKEFYCGQPARWEVIANDSIFPIISEHSFTKWLGRIKTVLGHVQDNAINKIFCVGHAPGIGGSTVLRQLGWRLHKDYTVLLAKNYIANSQETRNVINRIHDVTHLGIVVLIDEDCMDKDRFIKDIKEIDKNVVALVCLRNSQISCLGKLDDRNKFICERLTDDIARRLKDKFELYSNLEPEILSQKREQYNMYINSSKGTKCPFMIGLYYLEKDFTTIDRYVWPVVSIVSKELGKILGFMALCDCYGTDNIKLPKKIINNFLRLNPFENLLKPGIYGEVDLSSIIYSESIDENSSGEPTYAVKHVLISEELLEQLSVEIYDGCDLKGCLHIWAEDFIKYLFQWCRQNKKNIETCRNIIERMFILKDAKDENTSKFARIIEKIENVEYAKNILELLVSEAESVYDEVLFDDEEDSKIILAMMVSHYSGHLGRLYVSKNGVKNYEEAIRYSDKSLNFMEQCGQHDKYIYHMHANVLDKKSLYDLQIEIDSGKEIHWEQHFKKAMEIV